jgi:hypothetical protein
MKRIGSVDNDDSIGDKFPQAPAYRFRVGIAQNAVRGEAGTEKAVNELDYRGTGQVQDLFENQVKNLSGRMCNGAPPFHPGIWHRDGWRFKSNEEKMKKSEKRRR